MSVSFDLTGRVALVTGANTGLGQAIAVGLAQAGADIVAVGRSAPTETATAVKASGRGFKAISADLSSTAPIADVVAEAGPVDILVNNAGIGGEPTIEETTEADFDRTFAVHVKGTFFATKAVVPRMKEQRRGKIINISSVWGMVGHHYASPYCGAKAAILGLTKAWAKELAPWNIHVNAIAPGGVLTEMVLSQPDIEKKMPAKVARVPLGRYCDPVEISYLVAFLASREADFITGQTVSANGGETIVGI